MTPSPYDPAVAQRHPQTIYVYMMYTHTHIYIGPETIRSPNKQMRCRVDARMQGCTGFEHCHAWTRARLALRKQAPEP